MTKEIIGRYSNTLDKKRRVAIPAKLRQQFFNGEEQKKIILLMLNSMKENPELMKYFGETKQHVLGVIGHSLEEIKSTLFGDDPQQQPEPLKIRMNAYFEELDAQDRITIPSGETFEEKEKLQFVGVEGIIAIFRDSILQVLEEE